MDIFRIYGKYNLKMSVIDINLSIFEPYKNHISYMVFVFDDKCYCVKASMYLYYIH